MFARIRTAALTPGSAPTGQIMGRSQADGPCPQEKASLGEGLEFLCHRKLWAWAWGPEVREVGWKSGHPASAWRRSHTMSAMGTSTG